MNLFETGDFTLHSGRKTTWRINAECLTEKDLDTLARVYAQSRPFQTVVSIPRGGDDFAKALAKYRTPRASNQPLPTVLLVDDVLTTGASMREARRRILDGAVVEKSAVNIHGVVIFSRAKKSTLDWVDVIWKLPGWWFEAEFE